MPNSQGVTVGALIRVRMAVQGAHRLEFSGTCYYLIIDVKQIKCMSTRKCLSVKTLKRTKIAKFTFKNVVFPALTDYSHDSTFSIIGTQ